MIATRRDIEVLRKELNRQEKEESRRYWELWHKINKLYKYLDVEEFTSHEEGLRKQKR